ncbi:tail fiber domain-containing protein [uncultured Azohydromonas sp.]|jgi:hypothetical protein|uniref:tail fiber domain-containing protein n=1 Tax=uncultured Azohydromonas sp. TaxID=487342 RepID=UPI0026206ED2|nr:tail fiber domain-containing protein [uncultured Azohydromonas sp.]
MAAEPYVSKQPGDIIRAGDWNDMQSKARDEIRGHTHTGDADGKRIPRAGIEPGAVDGSLINTAAEVTVKSLTTTDLRVNGKAILGDIADLLGTVKSLGNDKLNRAGDTVKGSLTISQDLAVGNALTVAGASTFKNLVTVSDLKSNAGLKATGSVEGGNGSVRIGLDEGGSGVRCISFLRDAKDEANAGKISYRGGFGSDTLNIVGAGVNGSNRVVRIYDNLIVGSKLTISDMPDVVASIRALENSRVNRTGDTISGSLTVQQNLSVSGAIQTGGILSSPSGLRFDGDRNTHIDCDGSLYRYKGQVYLTCDDNIYLRDYVRNKYIHMDVANTKINYSSDERLKKDFRGLTGSLSRLLSLEGLHFRWKDDDHGREQVGFVAQNVRQRFPELVDTGPDGMLSVHYTGFIPFLVEALKEQQAQIQSLRAALAKQGA